MARRHRRIVNTALYHSDVTAELLKLIERPPTPNVLRLQLDPDRMSLRVNINEAGDPFETCRPTRA